MTPRTRLHLEHLADRITPASLGLSAGVYTFTADVSNDAVILATAPNGTLNVNDAGHGITLDANAIAAGWLGSGTGTVTGIPSAGQSLVVNLTGGCDSIQVKSIRVPVAVDAGATTNTVYICSNGSAATGDLLGILGPVTVYATSGSTALYVSDYGGHNTPNATVTGDSITGLTMVSGLASSDIAFGTAGGSFSIVYLLGENSMTDTQTWTIADPTVGFRLSTGNATATVDMYGSTVPLTILGGNGNDTFNVYGDTEAVLNGGSGNDYFLVDYGVTLTGSIAGAAGTDTDDIFGVVTGAVNL